MATAMKMMMIALLLHPIWALRWAATRLNSRYCIDRLTGGLLGRSTESEVRQADHMGSYV